MSKLALLGGKPEFTANLETYPHVFGDELEELRRVLETKAWNIGYGNGPTQEFEEKVAEYIGVKHAVMVNTGGMALQMALRVLGVVPGDEIIFQVNTCVADAFAVMNAQGTPIFADTNPETFMLNRESLESWISPRTKVLMPIHWWGRPEDLDMITDVAQRHNLTILEDACLAFGAQWKGRPVGSFGKIGCFSLGCLKSMQTGEGGLLVTNEEGLWKELLTLRAWGESQNIHGIRDHHELAWNGRPSQFVSAVALAQMRYFPQHLEHLNVGANRLQEKLENISGIINMPSDSRITKQAYTQFMFHLNEEKFGCSRDAFAAAIIAEGIPMVIPATFENINTYSFWTTKRWRTWITDRSNIEFIERNYNHKFRNALHSHAHTGICISRDVLTAPPKIQDLAIAAIQKVCDNANELRDWNPPDKTIST